MVTRKCAMAKIQGYYFQLPNPLLSIGLILKSLYVIVGKSVATGQSLLVSVKCVCVTLCVRYDLRESCLARNQNKYSNNK